MKFAPVVTLGLLLLALPLSQTQAAEPLTRVSTWNGYKRIDFEILSRPCLLVFPKSVAPGAPWILRTEFFGQEPQADLALLARGWHLAYMDVKDMYGSPTSVGLLGRLYAYVVPFHGLSKRVVLEGFSRGGLYAFNFAAAHPKIVAALYLDAPVLDIRSWPGKNRDSPEWRQCLEAYGLNEEKLAAFKGNPLDYIPLVAAAKIPIIAVCGDSDTTVPFAENTGVLEKRYRELNGTIEVILKPGGDHHPHSLKDPAPIVDFLVKNAQF